ncbi:phosphoribosyltransferase [Azospirillum picis]|uniref:Xanthine phosphoribosyltransferase n=1 Tax=Azospirillum picis TaxID=488438 RepID=A0ABU0MIT2_9PROT|nr:hypothetical protein [Azospirillum picis]MBP2299231.1 xanthine phosphoribosyltransferase [Azospirillum picis]MDQ0533131.1 xanthine phosphoribosyltransferase [Azospirillum picis]
MDKRLLSWEEYEHHCLKLAEMVLPYNPTEVIAVARKGLIPAFLIANVLKRKVGFWYPTENKLCSFNNTRLLFVDDMMARGRTYLRLKECFPDLDYRLATVFIDHECPYRPDYYSFVAHDWIIAPFSKREDSIPGVRRDFRETVEYFKEW